MRKKHHISDRHLRIADQIQRDLSIMIRREVPDPRMNWVTIQSVALSRDYAYAKVYFTTLKGDSATIQAILDDAASHLRNLLFKRLQVRTAPMLHFIFDRTLEQAAQVMRLLNQANATDTMHVQN